MSPLSGREDERPTLSPQAQGAFDSALDAHDGGDLAAAESFYRQAVAADPRMTVAHNNLGMVLIQQERTDEAIAALQKAVSIDPGYAEAYNNLGFAYRRMGRDQDAADRYEKFLDLAPDVEEAPKIREWVAGVRAAAPPPPEEAALGGGEAGAPPVEAAPPGEPSPPEAAAPQSGEGDFSDFFKSDLTAAGGAAAAAAAAPGPEPPQPSEAPPAEGESGLSSKAEEEFSEFFGGGPGAEAAGAGEAAPAGDSEAGKLHTEAMIKYTDGDMQGAADLCRRALEHNSGHFPSLLLAGRAAMGQNDFSRAATMFQKAAGARRDDSEVHYFLGQCYEKRGLVDEAHEAYQKCLEVAPDGPRAERLAKWLEKRKAEGQVGAGKARCELCLRTVAQEEIAVHEGRKTCKQCLETLGAKPVTAEAAEKKASEKKVIRQPASSGAGKLLLLLLLILAGAGGYVALAYFDYVKAPPWIEKLLVRHLHKRPKVPLVRPPKIPRHPVPPVPGKVVPREMAFGVAETLTVMPLEEFELTPELRVVWPGGRSEPPRNAEPVRFEFKEHPEDMLLDASTGRLTWTPGLNKPLEVPSRHKVSLWASCGKKSAAKLITFEVKYAASLPVERNLGLTAAYRASSAGLAAADLDGDGHLDLAAACGGPLSGQLSLMLSGGSATSYEGARKWELSAAPVGLAAADLDGDGRADLGWAGWPGGRLRLLRGAAGTAPGRAEGAGRAGEMTESLLLADLNGDRRADFAAASRKEGRISIRSSSGTALGSAKLPPCGVPPVLLALGPAQDGARLRLGLVLSGGARAGKLLVYSLKGGKLVEEQRLELPAGLVVAARSGDFDGDGKEDAALLFGGVRGALAVLDGADPKKLTRLPPSSAGELPLEMAAGDVNGDGRTDLAVAGPGAVRVYLAAGRGRFVLASESSLLGLAGPVAVWGSRKGRGAKVAALNLKGRAWVITLPPPKPRKQPAPPAKAEKKEGAS